MSDALSTNLTVLAQLLWFITTLLQLSLFAYWNLVPLLYRIVPASL